MKAGVLRSHGGNVYEAARQGRRRLDQIVDFSASINPLGPSPRAIQAVRAELSRIVHYPDPDCTELRKALADHWRLPPNRFMIGNGSSELIYLLPLALSIRRALVVGPTFSEYERAVAVAEGRMIRVQAGRREQYQPPIGKVARAVQRDRLNVDALFFCNPNSPTGSVVQADEVLELAVLASRQGAWVIVDETFGEYCNQATILPQIARLPRLLVLRSFTKFYALPALRIGYLAGPETLLRNLRDRQPPWSVNQVAQGAALAALQDATHARQSLAFMERERPRLARSLARLPGVAVFPSAANFLLLELPSGLSAAVCAKALRRQGLLIRDCSSVPGLNRRTVRVAVKLPGQNRRLVAALAGLLRR
ncbi:MAG: threonine-phosphate decarboxylase [Nitrospira sp.]|nr:threonine-phosphate decarboxylase [Nitrospira sp.]